MSKAKDFKFSNVCQKIDTVKEEPLLCGGTMNADNQVCRLCVYNEVCSKKDISSKDDVNHPQHYEGKYECIDIIEYLGFGYHLGNVLKYIWRAGKKNKGKELEDLKKARWYIDRKIKKMEEGVQI